MGIKPAIKLGNEVIAVDQRYFRPTEVDLLVGNPTKAYEKLGWKSKHDLKSIVNDMVDSDLIKTCREKYLRDGGYQILNYFE